MGAGRGTLASTITELLDVDYVQIEYGDAMPDRVDGVIVANELLDNLPFRLVERGPREWFEVYVDDGHEALVPVSLNVDAPVGARIPIQERAAQWVRDAAAAAPHVIVFDYCDTTESMANRPWREWLRTYRSHSRGGHPLENPGHQDITCEVAVDQLPPPSRNRSQAEFLREHGIGELVDAARRGWRERAHIGDLESLRHRSRVHEADALLDPTGLGAFRVLEWLR